MRRKIDEEKENLFIFVARLTHFIENQEISDYIYNRLSKFYFFLDDFASTEQCILKYAIKNIYLISRLSNIHSLREFYMDTLKFPKLNLPLASYNELMTACLELGILFAAFSFSSIPYKTQYQWDDRKPTSINFVIHRFFLT